jgi:hypothetical protein
MSLHRVAVEGDRAADRLGAVFEAEQAGAGRCVGAAQCRVWLAPRIFGYDPPGSPRLPAQEARRVGRGR